MPAEERGGPDHQLSAATENEPIPQVERVEPVTQVLETIWEGTDEDRSSTAPSLVVHDSSDEALRKQVEERHSAIYSAIANQLD